MKARIFVTAAACAALWSPSAFAQAPVAGTDHSQFVGNFAIGVLGVGRIRFNVAQPNETVDAAILGGRYWLSETMGIDAGVGLSFGGASTTMGDTTTDNPQPALMILHGGLPLVMADSQHFTIQVVPETNIGFAGNTREGDPDDTVIRGFHFSIGARAGAEVHFGFIGIPQLSLQAGIAVGLSYDRTSTTIGDADTSSSQWFFGGRGAGNPWDIFTSSIAALYYFDD